MEIKDTIFGKGQERQGQSLDSARVESGSQAETVVASVAREQGTPSLAQVPLVDESNAVKDLPVPAGPVSQTEYERLLSVLFPGVDIVKENRQSLVEILLNRHQMNLSQAHAWVEFLEINARTATETTM